MLHKNAVRKLFCLVMALSTGVLYADLGCVSSAQLRDFIAREFISIASEFIADSVSSP